jgi:predicted DNA binding protein
VAPAYETFRAGWLTEVEFRIRDTGTAWADVFVEATRTILNHDCSSTTLPSGAMAMIRARYRMALAEDLWVTEVSTSFPDATLRLLTGVPKGDRALELGEVRAENPTAVTDAIREHADISEYDQLYVDDTRAIGQYEADEKSLYEFLWASSLPPEFPIVVENGQMEFDLTATRQQFEAFTAALDDIDRRYELLTLIHTDEQETLLTDRQREYLTVAYHHGYFDVPRECTLAELAGRLEVDKSSVSETIRRGVDRVLGQFLLSHD